VPADGAAGFKDGSEWPGDGPEWLKKIPANQRNGSMAGMARPLTPP